MRCWKDRGTIGTHGTLSNDGTLCMHDTQGMHDTPDMSVTIVPQPRDSGRVEWLA